jgi:hypothetical protein
LLLARFRRVARLLGSTFHNTQRRRGAQGSTGATRISLYLGKLRLAAERTHYDAGLPTAGGFLATLVNWLSSTRFPASSPHTSKEIESPVSYQRSVFKPTMHSKRAMPPTTSHWQDEQSHLTRRVYVRRLGTAFLAHTLITLVIFTKMLQAVVVSVRKDHEGV